MPKVDGDVLGLESVDCRRIVGGWYGPQGWWAAGKACHGFG